MAYTLQEGQGSLFKNTNKKSEKSPDYNGEIVVNGEAMWLNAWMKKSKSGVSYLSVAAKPKGNTSAQTTAKSTTQHNDLDDDIPF